MEITQFAFLAMSIILFTLCASLTYCVVMDMIHGEKIDNDILVFLIFFLGVTGMFVWGTTLVGGIL